MTRTSTQPTDYYQLLGVAHNASAEEIRRAYRAAMKDIHPDRQSPDARQAAEERAKRLNVVYTTLSQPEKRRQYDQALRAAAVQEEIMARYAGDMITNPRADNRPLEPPVRSRYQSERQRREQKAADRSATSSLFFVFGGAALFVILAIVMFAVVGLIVDRLF